MSVSVHVIDEHGTKCGLKINFELLPLKGLAQLERLSKGMNAPLQPTNITAVLANFVEYIKPRLREIFSYQQEGWTITVICNFEVLVDWQEITGEIQRILSGAGVQVAGGAYRGEHPVAAAVTKVSDAIRQQQTGSGRYDPANGQFGEIKDWDGTIEAARGLTEPKESGNDITRWRSPRVGATVTTAEVNPRRP